MSARKRQFSLRAYGALEKRIAKSELEALVARWEFGALLLQERRANGGKQLPHGRLDQLCKALHLSGSDVHNRMQFAEQYQRREVANALAKYGSWHEIVRQGLGDRWPKAKQAQWTDEADGLLFDLDNVPAIFVALGEIARDMTPAQRATALERGRHVQDALGAFECKIAAVEEEPNARAA